MEINKIFSKIYAKMGLALLVSFISGLIMVKVFPPQFLFMLSRPVSWLILLAVEIGLVVWFNHRTFNVEKTNTAPFVIYSILNGLTFSSVFLAYDVKLILTAFLITALTFFVMSILGRNTKKDVSKMNQILWFILIGVLIASVINIFLMNSFLSFITSLVSIFLFAIYIFVDSKQVMDYINANQFSIKNETYVNNLTTFFAFELYLDLINLFINLLNILSYFDDNN